MNLLRICEWGSQRAGAFWTGERRAAVHEAAAAWKQAHRLNALPLEWGGADGCTLRARQWVGIFEIDGGRIEIYPKTDSAPTLRGAVSNEQAQSTLRALLDMLEVSEYSDWVETDRAALASGELSFIDVWAYLLARHLAPQLRRGLPSAYLPEEDELPALRGRILLGRQLARFGDRLDRMACAWDEFSPDTSLLRLLKCACQFLRKRVSHPVAMGFLGDCIFMLDEVAGVPAEEALRSTERMVWTRATERLRPTFDLARRLLKGQGPQMGDGDKGTWVFLVDMNKVFESFCRVALEDALGVVVEEQGRLGHLVTAPMLHSQIPDYLWQHNAVSWIGDAKWKRLEGKVADEEGDDDGDAPNLRPRLSTADIRQLTTYAELQFLAGNVGRRSQLAVFYPGTKADSAAVMYTAWNSSRLHLVPVAVTDWQRPGDAMRAFGAGGVRG